MTKLGTCCVVRMIRTVEDETDGCELVTLSASNYCLYDTTRGAPAETYSVVI